MFEELVQLTRDLWMWCLERNIHIHVHHLLGNLNIVADRESRSIQDRSDWKLDMNIFKRIDKTFSRLFSSRLTHQCHRYFSWQPDPFTKAADAILQDWSALRGFANPTPLPLET